jgi:MtN3 and saliva related transmembrane protein
VEILGFVAGTLTTACWIPQVVRTLRSRSAADLSWLYLCVLSAGTIAWIAYGIGRHDPVIVVPNSVTLALVATTLGLKLTTARGGSRVRPRVGTASAKRPGPATDDGSGATPPVAPSRAVDDEAPAVGDEQVPVGSRS